MIKKPIRSILRKFRHSGWKQQYAEIRAIGTKEQLTSFQEEYLERLLLHTYHNVPHYTKIFEEIALVKNDKLDFLNLMSYSYSSSLEALPANQ